MKKKKAKGGSYYYIKHSGQTTKEMQQRMKEFDAFLRRRKNEKDKTRSTSFTHETI